MHLGNSVSPEWFQLEDYEGQMPSIKINVSCLDYKLEKTC